MTADKLRQYECDGGNKLCDYTKYAARYRKISDEILHMCVSFFLVANTLYG